MDHPLDWTLWIMLAVAAALELSGDLLFKWWADTNRWLGFAAGLVVYCLALVLFAFLLRRAELGVIFSLWVGVAAVLVALGGWWFFGEALSVRRIAGIALIVGGIVLVGQ